MIMVEEVVDKDKMNMMADEIDGRW